MINHLEPIDIAMVKALEDGKQTSIYEFTDLAGKNYTSECLQRSHRVNLALIKHGAYKKEIGGGKRT